LAGARAFPKVLNRILRQQRAKSARGVDLHTEMRPSFIKKKMEEEDRPRTSCGQGGGFSPAKVETRGNRRGRPGELSILSGEPCKLCKKRSLIKKQPKKPGGKEREEPHGKRAERPPVAPAALLWRENLSTRFQVPWGGKKTRRQTRNEGEKIRRKVVCRVVLKYHRGISLRTSGAQQLNFLIKAGGGRGHGRKKNRRATIWGKGDYFTGPEGAGGDIRSPYPTNEGEQGLVERREKAVEMLLRK